MSVVFYKFKSAKDYDTTSFDGAGISVFDLKREIMIAKKLGKGTEFDLAVYNAQTNEEYAEDEQVIQRNSSVLVSRIPAKYPGKGGAQRYLGAPVGPMSGGHGGHGGLGHGQAQGGGGGVGGYGRFGNQQQQQYQQQSAASSGQYEASAAASASDAAQSAGGEQDRIAMMFQQENEQWLQTQDRMANQRPVYRGGGGGGGGVGRGMGRGGYMQMPYGDGRPPPAGYICYRCGLKGHYINTCPTIGDKEFDNRPKLKRTTGIPKMFLKTVEQGAASGLMVTQTGDLVVATPNDEAWVRMSAQRRTYLGVGDAHELAPVLPEFKCGHCHKLVRDGVTTPCCRSNYCDECTLSLAVY
ncbi:DWNN domain-containing protein [Entophlyctis helioformis]|nr:DWNN domain-containing protein [Entophlyctis helioformis]